jgi:hypothetical protein
MPTRDHEATIDASTWITIPRSVVSTQRGGITLVHDMITHEHYRLDDVGTRVWQLIDAGATVDGIVRVIGTEYTVPDDIPAGQVHDDVVALLSDLRHRGLVSSASVRAVEDAAKPLAQGS